MKVGQWPLLGLLLVASFLGHDLLMAGEAPAASRPEAGSSRHGSGAHALQSDHHAPQAHEPTPEHRDNCHIGQLAVPRNDDAFGRADRDIAPGHGLVRDAAAANPHTGAIPWEEPHWPPGTLRALFQVYRI
jgi:hypothetical protein